MDRITEIIAGADAVISTFGPPKDDARFFSDISYTDQLHNVTARAITAVRKGGLPLTSASECQTEDANHSQR